MKKKLLSLMTLVVVVLFWNQSAISCSSFAVYADKPFYGMNFDYDMFPMKVKIVEAEGLKSFHLAFERPVGNGKKIWADTAGMNSLGLFAAVQEELPYQVNPSLPGSNDMYAFQLYGSIYTSGTVTAIENICSAKRLVQHKAVSVHCLIADTSGKAIVAEAGKDANSLIKMDGRFMVMTNFANRSLIGKNYKDAKGIGDKRYIAGYDYLSKNSDKFTMGKGMITLELMKNLNPKYPTCCSMVFDPIEKTVYFALYTDFQKIFKVSLEEGTISSFKGFSKSVSLEPGQNGILLTELAKL